MDKNTKETLLGIDLYKNLSREELILGLLASTAREDEMKPRKVFVEAAEMEKIDDVLRAFGSYIHGHYYFDIPFESFLENTWTKPSLIFRLSK